MSSPSDINGDPQGWFRVPHALAVLGAGRGRGPLTVEVAAWVVLCAGNLWLMSSLYEDGPIRTPALVASVALLIVAGAEWVSPRWAAEIADDALRRAWKARCRLSVWFAIPGFAAGWLYVLHPAAAWAVAAAAASSTSLLILLFAGYAQLVSSVSDLLKILRGEENR